MVPLASFSIAAIIPPVPDPSLNALWCRAIAEELARAGAGLCVLCPGSRNSPLLFALAEVFGSRAIGHVDERSAGFIAIGAIRAGGAPAVVCVTSGSAVANVLPAAAEAQAAGLPLILLAADRPRELHGCRAPQTMPQAGAAAGLFARELALPEPVADDRAVRSLRARISRAAQGDGPVLIDVPLREPLLSPPGAPAWPAAGLSPLAVDGRRDGRPYTAVGRGDGMQIDVAPAARVMVVAGADARDGDAVLDLAEQGGWPVLADACSGLRRRGSRKVVCRADALVAGPLAAEPPSLIIQAGDVPLSRSVYEWLDRCAAETIVLEPDRRDHDWLARASLALHGSVLPPERPAGDRAWTERWLAADRRAGERLAAAMAAEPWGEVLAAHLVCTHAGWSRLVLASSMAVRHGNLHLPALADDRQVIANRGLNGIDGTVGTLAGAAADGRASWLLVGDLALLHDLPGLAALRGGRGRGAIVVLNNDGGGLFDFLAVAGHPGYRPWIRAEHGMDFAGAARQFGLAYHRCASRSELEAALAAAEPGGWHLVECDVRGTDTVARHRALIQAMAAG